jgi:hypothetical protein
MKYRVRIKQEPKYKVRVKLPEAKTGMQVDGSLYNELASFGGADAKDMMPKTEVRKTITKVPREEANLEAEGGETVLTFDPAGYPLFYEIKGPRHSNNGVPLSLPDDSFIFSDTRSMRINDQEILDMFGLSKKKGGYTPADISKKYLELNKYREILQREDSDKIARASAERMIKNMLVKLGALAVAQESKKGFPQGIPAVAKPYMEAYGIAEEDLIPQQPEQLEGQPSPMEAGVEEVPPTQAEEQDMMMSPEMMDQAPMAMYGAVMGGYNMPFEYAYGGDLPRAVQGAAADRGKTKEELEAELRAGKANVQKTKTLPDGTIEITRKDGSKVYAAGTVSEQEDYSNIKPAKVTNLATNAAKYEKDICAKIKSSKKPIEYAVAMKWILPSRAGEFANCVDAEATAKKETSEFYELEEEPVAETEQQCECEDPTTGEMIYSEPDADGNCPPCSGYVENETEQIEPEEFQQPGTVFPEDIMNLRTAQNYQIPRKDPAYVEPRGTQVENYGIDWRGEANAIAAGTAASQRALGQLAGSTPGTGIAGMYAAQKAQAEANKEAINRANQFNTQVRNAEIDKNTELRQNFLDKQPVYKLDYDAKLAQQIQNQARNKNEKAAAVMAQRNKLAENSMNVGLVNAGFENKAFDPVTKKVITTKGRALRKDPNAAGSGQLAARTKEIMNSGIQDAGTAYKIAMQELGTGKYGGATMFEKGGYIYTVFPAITL